MGPRNEGISNIRINRFLKNHLKTKALFLSTVPCSSKEKREQLPYALIMTTDDWRGWVANDPGHWIAILKIDNKNAEYFDSTGNEPNSCIKEYLKEIPNIKKSTEQLQSFSAVTCGFYCIYFILMRAYGESFETIVEKLKNKGSTRDIYVEYFIKEIEKWLFTTT